MNQLSYQLATEIFEITKTFPKEEKYFYPVKYQQPMFKSIYSNLLIKNKIFFLNLFHGTGQIKSGVLLVLFQQMYLAL